MQYVTRDVVVERLLEDIAHNMFLIENGVCNDCNTPDTVYGAGETVLDTIPEEAADRVVPLLVAVCFDCLVYRAAYTIGAQVGAEMMTQYIARNN